MLTGLEHIEYYQKYPVSNQLYRVTHYLNKLHQHGYIKSLLGIWGTLYPKLDHIIAEIYDQEYVKHNTERYLNGKDTVIAQD